MTNLNISIPDSMKTFINEQAERHGYTSANDYICSLIMQAQKKVHEERLEQILIEGLERVKSIDVTDEWWENRRNELIHKANHSLENREQYSEVETSPKKYRVAGTMEGMIIMSDDFDDPLEDLKDYM